MSYFEPKPLAADDRDAGVECPHCRADIRLGEKVAYCPACGQVHHFECWSDAGGCGAYECAPAHRDDSASDPSTLRITSQELDDCVPLPTVRPAAGGYWPSAADSDEPRKSGMNRLAIASFVVAVLGIPLFGVVTGFVAIVLGSIALGADNRGRRGAGFALGGILLGLFDMVAWLLVMAFFLGGGAGANLNAFDFEPDDAELESIPAHVLRAIKANVLIESRGAFAALTGTNIGSGVILNVADGKALIVTNRHLIENNLADNGEGALEEPETTGEVAIKLIGQLAQPGRVVWVAPDGVDLALVSVPVMSRDVVAAAWRSRPKLAIGDEVFAIGNPHGLGWTHTTGGISQFRALTQGGHKIRVIQTNTAINPGNSGGGLYDEAGTLIGINTWTNDKRISEGLSFAISFDSLPKLSPPRLAKLAKEAPQQPVEQP